MSDTRAILQLENVSAGYGKVMALTPVSFMLEYGSLTMILGPNGAGKSTLLKAIAGLIRVFSGRIFYEGNDVTDIACHQRARRGLVLVPQGRGMLPGLTVAENLDLGIALGHWSNSGYDERSNLDYVYNLFPGLKEAFHKDCRYLSGGQMQMLAIARAILARPKLLLLDEPSSGLSPKATERVYDALEKLKTQGLAMIIVEQKLVPLKSTPSQTIVLQAGRVIHIGKNEKLSEEELASLYIGGEQSAFA